MGRFRCLLRRVQQKLQLQRRSLCDGPHGQHRKALAAIGVGCLAGALGSLVGMGGAFVTIPFLTHPLFGLPQRVAQGTSMASVLATASGGATGYMSLFKSKTSSSSPSSTSSSSVNETKPYFIGNISVPTAVLVSSASMVTAIAGAKFSTKLSNRQLKITLGLFMLCMAPSPIFREHLAKIEEGVKQKKSIPTAAINWASELWRSLLIGAFSGFQAGLYGVGGGAVVVPALCLFTDLSYKESLGTSLAIMLPTAIAGSIQHYRQGTMVKKIAIPLGIGCYLGSFIGSSFVTQLFNTSEEKNLKYCFTAVMLVLGLRTLRDGLRYIK